MLACRPTAVLLTFLAVEAVAFRAPAPSLARAYFAPLSIASRQPHRNIVTMAPKNVPVGKKNTGKKKAPSEEQTSFNPLIYLVPWKNPNSIFVYFILFFYVVDFLKTH